MKARLGAIDRKLSASMRASAKTTQPFWLFVAGQAIWIYPIAALALVILGWLTWYHAIFPVMIAYFWVIAVQWVIHRRRPHYDKKAYEMWVETPSFPSGHATESFAAATALTFLPVFPSMEVMMVAGVILYSFAILISLSRVFIGVHFLFDIIAGFFLGTVISALYVFILG
ncbi:phosphatase PAP2 family protein [Patescibacteria group bacterium]|nr:phosphatase PAP2 family protein [Patescibacteria group bacterium]